MPPLKTKIRSLTIIFSILVLSLLGVLPYLLFIQKGWNELNIATAVGGVFLILMLGGMFAIYRLTLLIEIDESKAQITFHYPFRLIKRTHAFTQVAGFQYKYLHSKIDYKSLRFKTSDAHVYAISDFETLNLREVERVSLKHFELTAGKEFRKLSDKEKVNEIRNSQEFDISQAKDIRTYLQLGIISILILSGIILYKSHQSNGTISMKSLVPVGASILIVLTMVRKLKKTNITIKNLTNKSDT